MQPTTDVWQHDLLPGERVLWTGQPAKWTRLRAGDLPSIVFSIVWISFTLPWAASQLTQFARTADLSRVPVALVSLVFVGGGLYISGGRFIFQHYRRRRTRYAVTDQRVLIRTNLRGTRVDAISLDTLPSIAIHDRGDGSGSITFSGIFEFMDIRKVQEVYQLILKERDRRRRVT
jgi:hypothetical protein